MLTGNEYKKTRFDTMVICSTKNQMVNYVAIMKHGIKKVYNITLATSDNQNADRVFNYYQWDKNLKEVLDQYSIKAIDINLSSYELADYNNIIKGLEKNNIVEENVLWHITGGQRHITLAINQYLNKKRKNDVQVYYEGNREQFYYLKADSTINRELVETEDEIDITINMALRLMGCNIMPKDIIQKQAGYEKYEKMHRQGECDECYEELCREFVKNPELQSILIESNAYQKEDESKLERLIDSMMMIDNINLRKEIIKKQLMDDHMNHADGKIFGYIFEHMFFHRLLSALYEYDKDNQIIADVGMNIRIKDNKENNSKSGVIDEFDILLVTKWGKVIAFECKSGGMTGDNAKSHNYSTYKIAGVYGVPYLICPLNEKALDSGEYDNIKQARRAATRANLSVYALEEIPYLVETIMCNNQYR